MSAGMDNRPAGWTGALHIQENVKREMIDVAARRARAAPSKFLPCSLRRWLGRREDHERDGDPLHRREAVSKSPGAAGRLPAPSGSSPSGAFMD